MRRDEVLYLRLGCIAKRRLLPWAHDWCCSQIYIPLFSSIIYPMLSYTTIPTSPETLLSKNPFHFPLFIKTALLVLWPSFPRLLRGLQKQIPPPPLRGPTEKQIQYPYHSAYYSLSPTRSSYFLPVSISCPGGKSIVLCALCGFPGRERRGEKG